MPESTRADARPGLRMSEPVLHRRRAGVLLHPTSLPQAATHGALGEPARHFVDWLAVGGFTVWQLLPLGPVGADRSPYYARSNHAGNPELVDLTALARAGLLAAERIGRESHTVLLADATRALLACHDARRAAFDAFRAAESAWLPDWALYGAIQARESGRAWWDWPEPLRRREPAAVAAARRELAAAVERIEVEQYLFHAQWRELRRYAAERGVKLFGDVPIYVAPDSVETWVHPQLFQLDASGRALAVAGVPPDYFSADGQLWGNPLYDWPAHERTGFAWWLDRLRAQFALYDLLRIDHFRGLEAYWSVPAGAPTAAYGAWIPAPGNALLAAAQAAFGVLDVVAEDLGVITPPVEKLRDDYALPGMRVAQFGLDGAVGNQHAPHAWIACAVGYSGTHDNDTTAGWLASLSDGERRRVCDYLGTAPDAPRETVRALVRTVYASVVRLAVAPLQDLLELGTEARMNLPGTTVGNWSWSFRWEDVPRDLGARCRRWNELYERI